MIKLTDARGLELRVSRDAIAMIKESGTSQKWHSVMANVQMFDGKWHEVQESPETISKLIEQDIKNGQLVEGN